ncbi:hypothetical protein LB503_006717 [Fusarium chuoi]|nr:hypothetical protein LB503_006717 [Fusarium chuoi]
MAIKLPAFCTKITSETMATPILPLSEEDESWMQWDPNVKTIWPNVAAPSPLPTPGSPAPMKEEPSVELTY